jgi:hypothetical protein
MICDRTYYDLNSRLDLTFHMLLKPYTLSNETSGDAAVPILGCLAESFIIAKLINFGIITPG